MVDESTQSNKQVFAYLQLQHEIGNSIYDLGPPIKFDATHHLQRIGEERARKIKDHSYSSDELAPREQLHLANQLFAPEKKDLPFTVYGVEAAVLELFGKEHSK